MQEYLLYLALLRSINCDFRSYMATSTGIAAQQVGLTNASSAIEKALF